MSLAAANLDPRHLEVEVTERTITLEAERAGRAIEHLADMGVKVSIDDFGTGHSSLRQLQSLPIRALKIDHSFVEKIHAKWPINRDYMAPPTTGELAMLDPALLVKPPKGMEVGYVPIVTRQENAKP